MRIFVCFVVMYIGAQFRHAHREGKLSCWCKRKSSHWRVSSTLSQAYSYLPIIKFFFSELLDIAVYILHQWTVTKTITVRRFRLWIECHTDFSPISFTKDTSKELQQEAVLEAGRCRRCSCLYLIQLRIHHRSKL